jgi:hypothetical protein
MSLLNITLDKDHPTAKVERVLIEHTESGSKVWLSILSTSAKCIRLRFEEEDSPREFKLIKESLLRT